MSSQTSHSTLYAELETELRETQADWQRRLSAIQVDRRRQRGPLDPDFAEQAVERENDATLDALDARGRQELEAVEAALGRLAAGTYGRCVQCEEAIAPERLRARPTSSRCITCASA
jgi:RNA polymerase-binding transcription factor DksA